MERFPRGSLPPFDFPAVATVAPQAVAKQEETAEPERKECDLSTTCPSCGTQMQPEHAHYKCPACGYRDSCCF
jgi:tRNA(Ile2) C34 agmatinyltransferase TiaS